MEDQDYNKEKSSISEALQDLEKELEKTRTEKEEFERGLRAINQNIDSTQNKELELKKEISKLSEQESNLSSQRDKFKDKLEKLKEKYEKIRKIDEELKDME